MRLAPLALAAALLLALSGCVPSGSHPSPSPSASATPVFASDAEALAAAEKAYAAYLKVSDEIGHDGGKDPERIASYVTADRLNVEERGATSLRNHGLQTSGLTKFSNASLEQVSRGEETEVAFYVCWDVTSVRVFDSTGRDVTPTDRIDKRTLEVRMRTIDGRLPLVLESDEPWVADSHC